MLLAQDLLAKLNECATTNFVGNRDWWFHLASRFTLAVLFGIGLELPELIHDFIPMWQEIKRKFKKFPRYFPQHNTPHWIKVVGLIGWGFVIVGIAGEFGAGLKVKNLDANIQECSDAKVREATIEAGDAAKSAQIAQSAADEAEQRTNAVSRKADNLLAELGNAEGKLRQIQIFSLARHLTDPGAFTEALKPLKREKVLFRSYVGDAEGWMLCTSLWDAAHKAEMDTTNQCGQWPLDAGGALNRGLKIYGPETEVILDAFVKGRIAGGAVEGDFGRGPLLIFVGIKNPVWLPEQALATPPQRKVRGILKRQK